jgi:polyhydroxyalkanoate synthesis regulator phasin
LPYTYLGEGEVPVLFEKYEYFIENGRLSDDEAAKLVQDLSANVEKDIGSLKKELKKLR